MSLFLVYKSNLLLGDMPETLGLLLFGVALVAVTVGLRWVLGENQKRETAEDRSDIKL
jgi:hypothetical protein